ncbi:MAG TPA: hypothetical protein VGH10_10695 [Actinomycetota bacterium]|jgi:hypothetical protein
MEHERDPNGHVHLVDVELKETLCGLSPGMAWESTNAPVTCEPCQGARREVADDELIASVSSSQET